MHPSLSLSWTDELSISPLQALLLHCRPGVPDSASYAHGLQSEQASGMFLPRDRERILFLGNAIRMTAPVRLLPSTSRRLFAGLHCEHLPASTFDRLHRQTTIMSTDPQNSASGAPDIGPAQGYKLETLLILYH